MQNRKKKELLRKIYDMLGANTLREMSDKYLKEDQRIITSKIENYHDPKLLINKVRELLEKIDSRALSKEERFERRLILWLYYHHAISYAIWGYKNRRRARKYSARALKYQPKNHPNQITRLLYLLIRDRFSEARRWARSIKDNDEKKTASSILKLYVRKAFFR